MPRRADREATSSIGPLPAALLRHFDEVPADPSPTNLIHGTHYWIGNEQAAHLWYHAVQGRGGAFLGVGTDLNYTLAAWARAELLVVIDFDQGVVDLHRAYMGVFESARTPDEFLAAWSVRERGATTERLHRRWADNARQAGIVRAFRTAQPMVTTRLETVRRRLREHALPSFVDDPIEYAHARALACDARVVVVRGDYDGERTLLAIAAALRAAALQLGVVYLSNVEQYLDYTANFRRNFLALDCDPGCVVLRTHARSTLGLVPGELYHYNIQSADGFAGWLRHSDVRRLTELLRHRTGTLECGLSLLERTAPGDDVARAHG
ncbi:MAG TPA: hypothetical protein VG755_10605 [Nannocystaceae bacterium]|nr:hypothetical protein [Nannocystaceae bacterium]